MILLYLGGLIGQMMTNYAAWNEAGGILGQALIQMPNPNPLKCFASAFTVNGVKSIGLILLASAGIFLYIKLSDRFSGGADDPRGFTVSKTGLTGRSHAFYRRVLEKCCRERNIKTYQF